MLYLVREKSGQLQEGGGTWGTGPLGGAGAHTEDVVGSRHTTHAYS